MEIASYFKKPRWLFGCYPTQEQILKLEENGVRCFVNLTEPNEKRIKPYSVSENSSYVSYSIKDHHTPSEWGLFGRFLLSLENMASKQTGKIFIHCRGGHGRAGMVVACLLCKLNGLSPQQALEETNKCHKMRPSLKQKWKVVASPHLYRQRSFVYRFFEPLVMHRLQYKVDMGFSRFSRSPIEIQGNIFQSIEGALLYRRHFSSLTIEYCKNLYGKEAYIERKKNTPIENGWEEEKSEILFQLYKVKFKQHPFELQSLMRTGLRPLILRAKGNYTWPNGYGTNIAGSILEKIREYFYINEELYPCTTVIEAAVVPTSNTLTKTTPPADTSWKTV